MLNDKAYGDQALNEFNGLLLQLTTAVSKINSGEGTAGKILADVVFYLPVIWVYQRRRRA